MENYLKYNILKSSDKNMDESKESKGKTQSSNTNTHFTKNSFDNYSSLNKEKLFNPKDYLLKERLYEFNKNNFDKIEYLKTENSNMLNKSINERKNSSANYYTNTYQDNSLNTRNNPTPNFSDFKTVDYVEKIYNNKNKTVNQTVSRNQTFEDDDISNCIDEAHECIKNHITETRTTNANVSDKNTSNFSKSNKTNNNMTDDVYFKKSFENSFKPKNLNRNINKIIKNDDSFFFKIQQDKIQKKHLDIDNTLEEIKNNLNNLSQKIKSNEIKHSSKNILAIKKKSIDSSDNDENNFSWQKNNDYSFKLRNKNISNINLRKNKFEKDKLFVNNTNRSYSSGDSVHAEDYNKSLLDSKLHSNKKDLSKNFEKSKLNVKDSNNFKASSSYNSNYNLIDKNSKNNYANTDFHNTNNNFKLKSLEDSIDHKIKSNSKNKFEKISSSEKKYYKRKKFNSGNIYSNNHKDQRQSYDNLVDKINNSISLMKEKNVKNKITNDYKTLEDVYHKDKEKEFANKTLDNKSLMNLRELKEKNDSIEKELDIIQRNFGEIKSIAKIEKHNNQEDLQINNNNLNLMYRSIHPKEFAKIKRNKDHLTNKSNDFSVSDSNKKDKFFKTFNNYISDSDDDLSRKNINTINNNDFIGNKQRIIDTGINNLESNDIIKDIGNRSANAFTSKLVKDKINNRNSKEKENYDYYYVKKKIGNVSSDRNNKDGPKNLKLKKDSNNNTFYRNSSKMIHKNKDFSKGGKIVRYKLNRSEKEDNNPFNYNNSNNYSKLYKSQAKYDNMKITKNLDNKDNHESDSIINQTINKKLPQLEQKIEEYEDKISSYKNLLNEYMPEDIDPELFTIINSYLNGKDRWFLIKRNFLKDHNYNLFWIREAELINLGFNINFNLFKNDNFDFCLSANNIHKIKEESKRFIREIEDLKSYLNKELEKKEILLEDKNNDIKKLNDKNQVLNEYLEKLEDEMQNNNLIISKLKEKHNVESIIEENQKLNIITEDFKINIKNLLEDNLKFKAENEKLEFELKNLNDNIKKEKTMKKSSSLGKIPIQNKNINNNNKLNNNTKIGCSSNRIKSDKKDKSENISEANELNISGNKTSHQLKNKLKSSIIDNLITESEFYSNKKEFDDLLNNNEQLILQMKSLNIQIDEGKTNLVSISQKLIEVEKSNLDLNKEKEKLENCLKAEKEKSKSISSEKENLEIQIKKIPELINEEITKFKKQKESSEKKQKQVLETLQNEKVELEAKLTEVVNLYNEVVDVNKKHENYINQLEECIEKYEKEKDEKNNNSKNDLVEEIENYKQINSEMEDFFKKEINDLKEILKIKEENNHILNKNKSILEKEITDLKLQNSELNQNLESLKKEILNLNYKNEKEKKVLEDQNKSCSYCRKEVDKEKMENYTDKIKTLDNFVDNKKIKISKESSRNSNNIEIDEKKKQLNTKSNAIDIDKNSENINNEEINNEDNFKNQQEINTKPKKSNKNYDIPLQQVARSESINKNSLSSNLNSISENQISENNKIYNNEINNEVSNLNSIIEDLNKKLFNCEKLISEKDYKINQLIKNCDDIREQFENNYFSSTQIDQILFEINSKNEKNLEEFKNYYEKQIQDYSIYTKGLETEKENQKLDSDQTASKLKKEISDKNSKIKDLEEKLKKLLIIEETSSTSKKSIKDLESANTLLKEKLAKQESEISEHNKYYKEINEIKNRLEIELNAEKEKFETYISKANDEKAIVFESDIKNLKEKLLEREMINDNLTIDMRKKDKIINNLEIQMNETIDKYKKLEEQMILIQKDRDKIQESLSKIILDYENEKLDLISKLEKADNTISNYLNEINHLKKNFKNKEHNLEQKQKQLEILETSNDRLIEEIRELKFLLSENEENLIKIKNETNDVNSKIEVFEEKLKLSNQNYEKLFDENEKNKIMIRNHQEKEKQLLKRINEFEESEGNLKKNILSVEETLEILKNMSSKKEDSIINENKNLIEINDKLQNQIKIYEKSIEEKNLELKKNLETISDYIEKIENLGRTSYQTKVENENLIDSLKKKLESLEIKLDEANKRYLSNEKSNEIDELNTKLNKLEKDCSNEKENLMNSISNLEEENLALLRKFENMEKTHINELEELKIHFEEIHQNKERENIEKTNKIIKEKDAEMQIKEDCFNKAQENSLRELKYKYIQTTQKLSDTEIALEEYKNNKSEKNKILKEQIDQLTLHNESLIQKLMEKDNYVNGVLTELETLKDDSSKSNSTKEIKETELLQEIDILKKNNLVKNEKIEELKNSIENNSAEMELYKQKISDLNNNLNSLSNQYTKEKNKYELAIKSLDEIIGNKIKEIEFTNNQKEEIKKELEESQSKFKEQDVKIIELKKELEYLSNKINEDKENFFNEREKCKEEKSVLVEKFENEIKELKSKLNDDNTPNSQHMHKKIKSTFTDNAIQKQINQSDKDNLIYNKKDSQTLLNENNRYSDNDELISANEDFKDLELSLTSEDREKERKFFNNEEIVNFENKNEYKNLEYEINLRNLEIQQLKVTILKDQEEINSLREKLSKLESDVLEGEIEKQDNEIKLENISEEIKDLKAINLELKTNEINLIDELSKQKEDSNALIDRLTIANEKYLNRINELTEEIGKLNDVNIMRTSQASNDVQNLSSVNNEDFETEVLKDELKQKDKKLMDIKEEMFNLKFQIEELSSEVLTKGNEINDLNKQNNDFNEKILRVFL